MTSTSVKVIWADFGSIFTRLTRNLLIFNPCAQDETRTHTLTFNAQGQLISIAFNAPSRNNAPQRAQAAGFSFTVTSLDSGTTYSYTMTAKDNNGNVLKTESGTFSTTGEAQGIEEISSSLQGGDRGRLIYHNGQIFILRGDKTYTLQGQEVR